VNRMDLIRVVHQTCTVFQIRSRGMALLCLILTGVPYNR
jgi:hypothetical protein